MYGGQTLIDIGKQLPATYRSNRQLKNEEEINEIRKRLLSDELLSNELTRTLTEEKARREKGGRATLAEALRLMKEPQQEPVLPEKPPTPEFEPSMPGTPRPMPSVAGEQVSDLTEKYLPKQEMKPYRAPLDPKQAFVESGAAEYGDVPDVKAFRETFIPSADQQSRMSERKWTQQTRENTPEKIKAANDLIDALMARNDLDDTEAGILRMSADTNADATVETMRQRFTGTAAQKKLFYDLYDYKVSLARAESQARVTGGAQGIERVPDKARDQITLDMYNLKNLYRVAGKFDPKFVGPVAGRKGNMTEWFGSMGIDEKVFRAEVQNYVDQLIKSTTGAQMSEPEAKRIMRETVSFNTNADSYFATLKSNIETLKMKINSGLETLKATKHDTSGLEDLMDGLNKAGFKTEDEKLNDFFQRYRK